MLKNHYSAHSQFPRDLKLNSLSSFIILYRTRIFVCNASLQFSRHKPHKPHIYTRLLLLLLKTIKVNISFKIYDVEDFFLFGIVCWCSFTAHALRRLYSISKWCIEIWYVLPIPSYSIVSCAMSVKPLECVWSYYLSPNGMRTICVMDSTYSNTLDWKITSGNRYSWATFMNVSLSRSFEQYEIKICSQSTHVRCFRFTFFIPSMFYFSDTSRS